jgi:hypothetical protein
MQPPKTLALNAFYNTGQESIKKGVNVFMERQKLMADLTGEKLTYQYTFYLLIANTIIVGVYKMHS